MSILDYNASYLALWAKVMYERESKVLLAISVDKNGKVDLFTNEVLKQEDIIKQFRHMADEIEKRTLKIIP